MNFQYNQGVTENMKFVNVFNDRCYEVGAERAGERFGCCMNRRYGRIP